MREFLHVLSVVMLVGLILIALVVNAVLASRLIMDQGKGAGRIVVVKMIVSDRLYQKKVVVIPTLKFMDPNLQGYV